VDSFERKLDDAQSELGLMSADRLSVKYVQEGSLTAAMFELLPTLLLIGATYW
jgi:AFG3 family protein